MYLSKAAIVGAGAMGAEIAQTISLAGMPVVIKDITPQALEKGIEAIRKIYQSAIDKGKMLPLDLETKMSLVNGTTSYEQFRDVNIVIEAVPENMKLKKKVFQELDKVCPSETILATNTSALSISELAQATKRPEMVIGIHFFFPAHVMKLVEVIPTLFTSPKAINKTMAFAEKLKKIPIRVKECPGFLVNRLLMPYLNEAAYCLQEGAATLEEIDQMMVNFGFPMGPFSLVDMVGVDVCKEVIKILFEAYGDKIKPAQIWDKLYKKGRYGIKAGAGFYLYNGRDKIPTVEDKVLPEIISQIQKESKIKDTKFSLERLTMPMINEAILCLEDGVSQINDIDLAMLTGLSFPEDKGGVLHYADLLGTDFILDSLESSYKNFGNRFKPAPRLKQMMRAGYLGKKSRKGFFEYRLEEEKQYA